jgi:hypothetical protein
VPELFWYCPTAVQAISDVQDTPPKKLDIAPEGLGVDCTAQLTVAAAATPVPNAVATDATTTTKAHRRTRSARPRPGPVAIARLPLRIGFMEFLAAVSRLARTSRNLSRPPPTRLRTTPWRSRR